MKILLTGSEGFIGQHIQSFLKDKHNLICLDKKTGNDLLTCDLDYDVDLVIHLAGLSGVRDSLDNPVEYWTNNVVASHRVFKQYKNGPKILYASSSTAREPWRNPYAMSKFYMETIAPHNALGMRFTTVYGPGARKNMLIPKILRNDVEYININHIRDFIHVNDIVSAVQVMINNTFRGVVDVGTGVSNKLVDIADYFKIDYKSVIGGETERIDNTADTSILNKFGWRAKINLYSYIEENRNVN